MRQADYFYGRLAARHALDSLGAGHYEVGTGASREPLWPLGIIGSISHNHNYAVAVAIHQKAHGGIGIGIDIESVVTPEARTMLQETVLSDGELAYLRKLRASVSLNTLISLVFSAKESFFKASFNIVGKYFDFDAIEVQHMDLTARSIEFVVKVQLAPQLPVGAIRKVQFIMINASTMLTSCHLPPNR